MTASVQHVVGAAPQLRVGVDDPARDDVRRLAAAHHDWSLQQTPCQYSFALDANGLSGPDLTLLTARDATGRLLGMAALRHLDPGHGEVKSMHTAEGSRGRGVGRAVLDALMAEAARRGYDRLSLETGTTPAFAAARALYESVGFRTGPPFAGYANTEHNCCMTLKLAARREV